MFPAISPDPDTLAAHLLAVAAWVRAGSGTDWEEAVELAWLAMTLRLSEDPTSRTGFSARA